MKADFDIGNLFYILLMIIFIIAGVFGKRKKTQHAPSPLEPTKAESTGDLLEKKLKEFFTENLESSEPVFKTSDVPGETLDVPLSDDASGRLESTVLPEETTELFNRSIENEGGILDSIDLEEGTRSLVDQWEDSIIDEIKLSEGRDLVPVDYNEELEELINNFDARQGFIYSEIFRRREY